MDKSFFNTRTDPNHSLIYATKVIIPTLLPATRSTTVIHYLSRNLQERRHRSAGRSGAQRPAQWIDADVDVGTRQCCIWI
ncbi:hypothetical protein Trydic_g17437 [Trypoxylus dichotomus]